MAEDAIPAQQPSSAAAQAGTNNTNEDNRTSRSRRNNNHRNRKSKWKDSNNNTAATIPKEKFAGRSDDLKGFIYDVTNAKGGVAYTRTTEEIARHVGKKYTSFGSYIRTAILTLEVPSPARPTPPIPTGTPAVVDTVDQEIFKERIRMYVKTDAAIITAMKLLYDLIRGQCRESLRSWLCGDDTYLRYSIDADSISLLKAIQAEMTGFRNKQYLPHALHQKVQICTKSGNMYNFCTVL